VNPVIFHQYNKGQGLVEYALILVLVVVIAIVILALMGNNLSNFYKNVVDGIPKV
jgi:pilus assembly protein Flp/PilA